MTDRVFNKLKGSVYVPEVGVQHVNLVLDGYGAIVADNSHTVDCTVTKEGTGVYQFVFGHTPAKFTHVSANLVIPTATHLNLDAVVKSKKDDTVIVNIVDRNSSSAVTDLDDQDTESGAGVFELDLRVEFTTNASMNPYSYTEPDSND